VHQADQLRRASAATVLPVHQSRKAGGSLRGSSALEGAVDTAVEYRADGQSLKLVVTKQKDLPDGETIRLHRVPVADSRVLESHDSVGPSTDLVESERRLLATLWDSFGTIGAGSTQLLEATEMPKSSFYRSLNSLVGRGAVVNEGTKARPLSKPVAGEAT
jgi:hypothetical protein